MAKRKKVEPKADPVYIVSNKVSSLTSRRGPIPAGVVVTEKDFHDGAFAALLVDGKVVEK